MVDSKLELLLLHALPLDGTMWAEQMELLPGATYAPTLYSFCQSARKVGSDSLLMKSSAG
ncbi:MULTISPECIES: hypothetical protein [Rhizobium]|uniref:hypothetical protein n=1 Tax=Rhizobium TaxID=379 RepID=UPI001B341941|nr:MULTISPECIES: hypothetical protein [Rhizobium]MBX4910893.1 hypothetical protein [Rhizobium bangladeshense]MBX4949166.1 hypothetical protein [Rhizobium binae]MBX5177097.1 hypothetical protein [Rhizobium lentis]MBX5253765.1 hypothetical protein [Rhizobium sp. NLR4b]MBX5260009.1 hypothetical protein [Rhizobium sp. NLR16b]